MGQLLLAIVLAAVSGTAQPAVAQNPLILNVSLPSDPKVAPIATSVVDDVTPKIGSLFNATLSKTAGAACNPPQPGGVVSMTVGDVKVLQFGGSRIFYVIAPVTIALKDCAGAAYVAGGSLDLQRFDGGVSEESVKSALTHSADKALSNLQQNVDAHRSSVENLLKYGFYMSSTEKQAFFTVEARENDDAVVHWAAPWGTASRAGLASGDSVVSVNGRATRGLSQQTLQELLEAANDSGSYVLSIKSGSGQSKTLQFVARDLTWYRSHVGGKAATATSH